MALRHTMGMNDMKNMTRLPYLTHGVIAVGIIGVIFTGIVFTMNIASAATSPYSPPTLFTPKHSSLPAGSRITVTGVVPSNSYVHIVLNKRYYATIRVGASATGVSGFSWTSARSLDDGVYTIRAQSERVADKKKSLLSNTITIRVGLNNAGANAAQGSTNGEEITTPLSPTSSATETGTSSGLPELTWLSRRALSIIGIGLLVLVVVVFLTWLYSSKPPEGPFDGPFSGPSDAPPSPPPAL